MTSPRFQSQSLNWLNRQRLHWSDRFQQRWRSFQVAMSWGTQMLLYPLYLAIQSSRLLLQHWQNRQAPARELKGEMKGETSAESAFQGALTLFEGQSEPDSLPDFVDLFLQTLSSAFTFKPRAVTPAKGLVPLTEQPQLQGIASLRLGSASYPPGSLVWVDDRNQLWSIPLAHQQVFQYKILTIVANHTLPQATSLKLLPERSQQLPPVRWLNRLVNWMQTSDLAQSTNLFQERQIHPLALPAAPFPNPLPPQWQQRVQHFSLAQGDAMLRFLDYHLALLEPKKTIEATIVSSGISSGDSVPSTSAVPFTPQRKASLPLRQLGVPAPELFQPELEPRLQSGVQPKLQSQATTQPIASLPHRSSHHPSPPGRRQNDRKLPTIASAPALSTLPVTALPVTTLPVTDRLISSPPLPPLSSVMDPGVSGGSFPDRASPDQVSPEGASASPIEVVDVVDVVGVVDPVDVVDPVEVVDGVDSFNPFNPVDSPPQTQSPNPQPNPSLPPNGEQDIEVKSEAIGYEHHPLEHLLHWIDRVVTWLEHQVAKLWGSVGHRR